MIRIPIRIHEHSLGSALLYPEPMTYPSYFKNDPDYDPDAGPALR